MEELDQLKNHLMQEWETTEREDKCLREYQVELEQLLQEKMTHVEELRLIHADINMVRKPHAGVRACVWRVHELLPILPPS